MINQNPMGQEAWHCGAQSRIRGGGSYFKARAERRKLFPEARQLLLYSQYYQRRETYPPETVPLGQWKDVIARLGREHKGDVEVAVYPYGALQRRPGGCPLPAEPIDCILGLARLEENGVIAMAPDNLVPFRWPRSWDQASMLNLLARSPINCLIVEAGAGPIAEAARGAGRTVLETRSLAAAPLSKINWGAAGSRVVISDLSWPRMKLARRGGGDDSEAGPTGAPWIDSNSWVARLAAVRAPGKPIWLDFKPDPKEPPPAEAGYVTAIADAAAAGARWIVTLDEALAKGLAAGNAEASRSWGGIVSALAFFEARREWARWDPWGPVGVLSSFAGDDEYMGQEVLNLAARRNLLYRVLDRKVPDTHRVEGLRAVLYVDSQPPAPALKAKLSAFAESGGLLILPPEVGKLFPPGKPLPCAVAGYRQQAAGKGRVAVATQDWDDPYFLAADVHSLVSRKHDPVRLFNGRSLWMHYSIEPKRQAALLQLVSFTSRANQSVSLAPTRPWRTAAMHTIGTGEPRILNAVDVDGHPEFQLPPFSWYVALEFKS